MSVSNLQTSSTPQLAKLVKPIIKVDDSEAPVLAVVVDHEGISNIVYEIVPMMVNDKQLFLFGRKRGKVETSNPRVIEELFNMGMLTFFIDEYEKCSRSMDHCVIYNTPMLFHGRIKDVIMLPKGLRIKVSDDERFCWCTGGIDRIDEIEEFLKRIGYDGYDYLAWAVAEGVHAIYVFDYVVSPKFAVTINAVNVDDMEELQGHLMIKRIDAEVNINVKGWYFRKPLIKVYNHEIVFEGDDGYARFPIAIFIPAHFFGNKGAVYLVINNYSEPIQMTIRSKDHGEANRIVEAGEVLVLYHPAPSGSDPY